MFNFEDELIIGSYRIPWLIWIQLLIMFLLVILLYYFSTTPSDLSLYLSSTARASSTATGVSYANHKLLTSAVANDYRNSCTVGENQIKETGASTSIVVQRERKEDVRRRDDSSMKDERNDMMFERLHHPCHLFGLAKQAFLKCLGLYSTPENPSRRDRKKES